jgi:glutamine synthetase
MFGYSWVRQGQHADLIEDVMEQLAAYRIEIEGMHTETGPGVYESAIRYDDALEAADQAALFKTTMKVLCTRHGCTPTFMAKWNADMPGSSGHIHQSLWDQASKTNLFSDAKAPHGLSVLGHRYLGGLMALSSEFTVLFSPTANSYKRYVPGMWAPLAPSWDLENRTCSLRLINQPGPTSTRIELRQTAADVNPYVAIASALGAGLWGIENAVEPPPPVRGDASAGEDRFPQTLRDAAALLKSSQRARAVLPDSFIDHYVRTREWEARQHAKSVSDWELARYFEII